MPDAIQEPIVNLPMPPTTPAPNSAVIPPGTTLLGRAPVRLYSWAFELTGTKNENMLSPIDQHKCRGRWSKKYLIGQTPDERFASAPDLPGLCFVVNTQARTIRRFDPLAQPQNEPVLKLAQRVFGSVMGIKYEPETPREMRDVTDDVLKSMAFWFYKLVLCKRAELLVGKPPGFPGWEPKTPWRGVPDIGAIRAMPGYVRGESFDNSTRSRNRIVPNEDLHYDIPSPEDYANRDGAQNLDMIPDPIIHIPVGGAKNYGYRGGYPSADAPPGSELPRYESVPTDSAPDDNEYAESLGNS